MNTQALYDQLAFIEQQSVAIEETIRQMKATIYTLIDENSSLKIENAHLREKIDALDSTQTRSNDVNSKTYSMINLERLYESGVHVCHNFYGAKRDEVCLLCESLLSQLEE
ncbi:DUF972 family protein [Granulicatella sp. zg-ZJ]|uniref:initiation control protein YabA n=1 Tax=unclassified Granulicatella TaxID=2630493 RepID=UPI0013C1D32A|nr:MULTISPECIES: initiation control protein YabA [unclassified Granulicatella]MBS4749742.1 DUF972 family protein [Carnobacteriaceae bacterium zg-ZUI78]NEW61986.1 DUF972 family protein [Granulicatella sp. zg-ZJ]NEW65621.1 DUF972 family protein [Granulicatella sp. zg-84]QMI85738.1 DUF972 family protein [Carnobacteriaceae bacterium zg-84]